jgi:hypothetical protein
MRINYVYNTGGEYVAFIHEGHLFTPFCDWLGVLVSDRDVHNPVGELIGFLRPDSRLVRDRSGGISILSIPPRPPMRPIRPVPPKRRLMMERLHRPLEDVFSGLRRPLTGLVSVPALLLLNELAGADLIAHDGTFLGRLSRSMSEKNSLANPLSIWGAPGAPGSVFNPVGRYGSSESSLSPFHSTTTTPPHLYRDGQRLNPVTVNPEVSVRIDPNAVISWLAMG